MSNDFTPVFDALRDLMLKHAGDLVVARDTPGDLVIRMPELDAKGQPGWFGTVTTKKSYVAFHLMPLYTDPSLADALSPELTRRRQGKTCFNFKKLEPDLFAQLDALTARARARGAD